MSWEIDDIREVVDTNTIKPFTQHAQIRLLDNKGGSLGENLFDGALSVLEVDDKFDNILGLIFCDASGSCHMVRRRDCSQDNKSSPVMNLQIKILDHHFRQVVKGSGAWRVGRWSKCCSHLEPTTSVLFPQHIIIHVVSYYFLPGSFCTWALAFHQLSHAKNPDLGVQKLLHGVGRCHFGWVLGARWVGMEQLEGSVEEKEDGERVIEQLLGGGAEAKREKGRALCL